jgi:hypothetical protein
LSDQRRVLQEITNIQCFLSGLWPLKQTDNFATKKKKKLTHFLAEKRRKIGIFDSFANR